MQRYGLRVAVVSVALLLSGTVHAQNRIRPGDAGWPVAWMSYRVADSLEEDFADMKRHGVDLVDIRTDDPDKMRQALELARRNGMKLAVPVAGDVDAKAVRGQGLESECALMIAGAYRGKAIDRHLFAFDAGPHQIEIEPPVYNQRYAYISKDDGRPVAHYWPRIGDPVKAEIIVPLKEYDGRQHLKIVSAQVSKAPADATLEVDSVTSKMMAEGDAGDRQLYQLSFDLTGLDGALLDKVGIAVFWEFHGYDGTWYIFQPGPVSVYAETTRETLRCEVREHLDGWSRAGGGTFPSDVLFAGRFGDEVFYLTGHCREGTPAVSYPLWDYSESFISTFREKAGDVEYPRTWGFPEIYGRDAYAWWMYTLHRGCAELAGIVAEEAHKIHPGLHIYRNTTRGGVFSIQNDRDGSAPELLTQHLDVCHLDPYVVMAGGYRDNIVRDMSYYAGLSRRYGKPLVPWTQAITDEGTLKNRGSMRHPTPEQLDRMGREHWEQGIDAIMWLGYGSGRYTFPYGNPATWDAASELHAKLRTSLPPKPEVKLAVVRPYETWALSHLGEGGIRNPADWLLTQFLEVWSVQHRQPYDVFEAPPGTDLKQLADRLSRYQHVVSTIPIERAWVLGAGTEGTTIDPDETDAVRERFDAQLQRKGWLP